MHSHIAWHDLRYILAVAEHGSLAGAARALNVNHSTVLRRVKAFEDSHGVRLFDRLQSGYSLTPAGDELLAAAREMKGVVATLERKLTGQDLRPEGVLRVTTTDTLMGSILPPILKAFRDSHPGIRFEISTANRMANLSERDADVAIRPASDPPETLVGRRVGHIAFALYGTPVVARGQRGRGAAEGRAWLAPDASLAGSAVGRWMQANAGASPVVLKADSLLTLHQAALAGLGIAALPCYLGDSTPGLVRVAPEPLAGMRTSLWILTHEDLRRTARVRAFTSFVGEALARCVPLLEGGVGRGGAAVRQRGAPASRTGRRARQSS